MLERNRHTVTKVIFGVLGIVFLGAALGSFYQFASSVTDENLFADVPSRIMVAPAGRAGVPGQLIVRVGAKDVHSLAELTGAVKDIPLTDSIAVWYFSPKASKYPRGKILHSQLTPENLIDLPPSVYVISVTAGGASDRAGMLPGDVITRLNGQTFANAQEADLVLRSGQSGRATAYEVYRDGQPLVLTVVLARFGFPIANLLIALAGIAHLCVGAFIGLRRPELKAARILGIFYMAAGFFLTVLLSRRGIETGPFNILRGILFITAGLCSFPLSVHVLQYFPRERKKSPSATWVLRLGYGLVACTLVMALIFSTYQNVVAVFALVVLGVYVFGAHLYLAVNSHQASKRGLGLNIAALLAGGIQLTILLGLVTNQPLVISIIGGVLFLCPIVLLYLIGRYRLLDLNIRVRRNVQYTLVSAVWGIVLAFCLLNLAAMLVTTHIPVPNIEVTGSSIEISDPSTAAAGEFHGSGEKFVLMVVAVVSWYGLWRLRRGGQLFIDKKYFRTRYDYRRSTNELAAVLSSNLSMVELGQGIAEKIAQLMHLKRSGVLFFRDERTCCCRQSTGIDMKSWEDFSGKVSVDLPQALKKFTNEFHAEYLPPGLKEIFQQFEFHYIVPIRSDAKLIGALVLGEKQSEAAYGQEDLDFLSSAAKQSSVAIENAFLYEELAEQERLKHELQIARRIQLASLPQKIPAISGLDIAGSSHPAQEVGGDFYDYLPGNNEDQLTIVIGDVSGKGTSAALYMSKVQGILRSLHTFGLPADDLLIGTNRILCADMEKTSFVTAMVAVFDTTARTVTVARAGHLPLYHYDVRKGAVSRIVPRGLGLGLNNNGIFSEEIEQYTIEYGRGDVFLFVTDGITEAQKSSGEEFGEDLVMRILAGRAGSSAGDIADALYSEVNRFAAGMPQHDDQTVVAVRIP